MNVLVIDDDPTVLDMIELVLTLEGFEVTVARDGIKGLEAAEASPPDVIVLDVMMPHLGGWEVAARLAQHPRLSRVPVVFCTAMAGAEETWRGWQLGAASYVPKPFATHELVDEVLRAVTTGVAAATLSTGARTR